MNTDQLKETIHQAIKYEVGQILQPHLALLTFDRNDPLSMGEFEQFSYLPRYVSLIWDLQEVRSALCNYKPHRMPEEWRHLLMPLFDEETDKKYTLEEVRELLEAFLDEVAHAYPKLFS